MQFAKLYPGLFLLTGVVVALAGCGSSSSDDDDDETPIPASRFSGTYTNPIDQGSFSFTVTSPRSADTAARSTLSGNVNSQTFGNLIVPGSFDEEINDMRLDSPAGSIPFVQILGSFDGNVLIGFTGGDIGSGPAVAIPDAGSVATTYCGTFDRTSGVNPTGGTFNLVVVNGVATAAAFDELDFSESILIGTATVTTLSLSGSEDGVVANGTISGASVSGTWSNNLAEAGNWTGSTGACP